MFVTSLNPVMGQGIAEQLLAALSTRPSAALLTTPKVHLFTVGPTAIGPYTKTDAFTEATFGGYAAQDLSPLDGPINLPGTEGFAVFADVNFIAGDLSTHPGQTILGYWVDDGGTDFYYGEIFDTPIAIGVPGDFIALSVIWAQAVYLSTFAS